MVQSHALLFARRKVRVKPLGGLTEEVTEFGFGIPPRLFEDLPCRSGVFTSIAEYAFRVLGALLGAVRFCHALDRWLLLSDTAGYLCLKAVKLCVERREAAKVLKTETRELDSVGCEVGLKSSQLFGQISEQTFLLGEMRLFGCSKGSDRIDHSPVRLQLRFGA